MNSFVFRPTRDSLAPPNYQVTGARSQRKRQKSINIYQIRFGLIFAFRFYYANSSRRKSKRNWSYLNSVKCLRSMTLPGSELKVAGI